MKSEYLRIRKINPHIRAIRVYEYLKQFNNNFPWVKICTECGGYLDHLSESSICGYCLGDYQADMPQCLDGAPCNISDQNCTQCGRGSDETN